MVLKINTRKDPKGYIGLVHWKDPKGYIEVFNILKYIENWAE